MDAAYLKSIEINNASIMGINLSFIPFHDAIEHIFFVLQSSKSTAINIGFANANNINVAFEDKAYLKVLDAFDYVFPDGIGLRIASIFHGQYYRDNISGTELVPALFRDQRTTNLRVFLLGDQLEKIPRAAQQFKTRFPNPWLVDYYHGYFNDQESKAIVERINASGADILLVGMGTPKQEKWIYYNSHLLQPRVRIAVGGLFQYWDGRLMRAPSPFRRIGMEWACILYQQPFKWKRYLFGNPVFLWRAFCSAARKINCR
jgi:N-acetylglucosaminyldiphosphoundecaprenol N-acetyl-beta-D-mannosaminyltransferase